jgi:hypothetical protein
MASVIDALLFHLQLQVASAAYAMRALRLKDGIWVRLPALRQRGSLNESKSKIASQSIVTRIKRSIFFVEAYNKR